MARSYWVTKWFGRKRTLRVAGLAALSSATSIFNLFSDSANNSPDNTPLPSPETTNQRTVGERDIEEIRTAGAEDLYSSSITELADDSDKKADIRDDDPSKKRSLALKSRPSTLNSFSYGSQHRFSNNIKGSNNIHLNADLEKNRGFIITPEFDVANHFGPFADFNRFDARQTGRSYAGRLKFGLGAYSDNLKNQFEIHAGASNRVHVLADEFAELFDLNKVVQRGVFAESNVHLNLGGLFYLSIDGEYEVGNMPEFNNAEYNIARGRVGFGIHGNPDNKSFVSVGISYGGPIIQNVNVSLDDLNISDQTTLGIIIDDIILDGDLGAVTRDDILSGTRIPGAEKRSLTFDVNLHGITDFDGDGNKTLMRIFLNLGVNTGDVAEASKNGQSTSLLMTARLGSSFTL
jgi:hypothetical protein